MQTLLFDGCLILQKTDSAAVESWRFGKDVVIPSR